MMKIAIAGYRGFVGQNLAGIMENRGHEVTGLSREDLYGKSESLAQKMEGAQTVINVAGTTIAKRWTGRRKRKIEASRSGLNTRIVRAINTMEKKPGHFISASGIAVYDDRAVHSEKSRNYAGDYLSKVVREWEKPLDGLDSAVAGTAMRMGVVLERYGGALKQMMMTRPFGFLGVPGGGRQPVSFIHMEDLVRAVLFIMERRMEGIVNVCSPDTIEMRELIQALAETTGTRIIFRVPEFMMRIGLGEAHIVVTKGQKVIPERLIGEGFSFNYREIDRALENIFHTN